MRIQFKDLTQNEREAVVDYNQQLAIKEIRSQEHYEKQDETLIEVLKRRKVTEKEKARIMNHVNYGWRPTQS